MTVTIYTPIEVAKILRVHKDFVYDEVAGGRMPHVRLGRNIRIREADLEKYLEARAS